MKSFLLHRLRRIIGGLLTVTFVLTLFCPVSYAEESTAASLSVADLLSMQKADRAVLALTESDTFNALSQAEKRKAAEDCLEQLGEENLIVSDSIYYDPDSGIVSYSYSCGVLGGISLDNTSEEEEMTEWEEFFPRSSLSSSDEETAALPFALPDAESPTEAELEETNGDPNTTESLPVDAIIYYAFDDTVDSTRYPHYQDMISLWQEVGLNVQMDTDVTLSDLKQMNRFDLCVLSMHGSYYTYTYGWLWQRTATSPVLLLRETSNFFQDMMYAPDLIFHNVIKINGCYCVLPSFFSSALYTNHMDGTIVFSETCEFLGITEREDTSFAKALLHAGASTVLGFTNNVYAIYSRNLVFYILADLALGDTVSNAVRGALDYYGENDVEWYLSMDGKHPHSYTSHIEIIGDSLKKLVS